VELIIFIGLQSSGKSTFYARRFADTHMRINLDMLKTRHRERSMFQACLAAKQPVVIDNTNPTIGDRKSYIEPAKAAGFTVSGYYFQSKIEECKRRNEQRAAEHAIPFVGVLGTFSRLVLPRMEEGFNRLYYVSITPTGEFLIEEWRNEI
jgi:predicted kinase